MRNIYKPAKPISRNDGVRKLFICLAMTRGDVGLGSPEAIRKREIAVRSLHKYCSRRTTLAEVSPKPQDTGMNGLTLKRRIAVVTGDHHLPDPTKRDGRYNAEDLETHRAMIEAFARLDRFDIRVFNAHGGLFEALAADPPDLIVNFCDTGYHNIPSLELHLPASFEVHGFAYTGATPQAIVLAYDKAIVRLLAQSLGVPVPREIFFAAERDLDDLPDLYPALIKPNTADGSVGITKDSVVRDAAQARAYLAWLREALPGRDALIQEYLPGPEYGIGVIGNPADGLTVLPPLEVDFSRLPTGLAPILSYESKALPDSPYWTEIIFVRAEIDPAMSDRLRTWTARLFARLGLRDYGRFDFRVGADGEPKLMEVNPNPAWANDGKLAFMAGFAGLDYHEMLGAIVDAALTRIARERG